ncbi:MAG TPA: IS200/IS605 family transposase [Candidatus Methanomethylicus sp.]|nr:IS200/IS605 family transposase [Candidatus Methanomethylicus sp.]HRR53735.1 IS200/IS605 family transposase [Candidatus Methanomethylicus sp.]HRU81011.1 IS200/IS605 family transposase [Candidatus Methanomethylicus sp.]
MDLEHHSHGYGQCAYHIVLVPRYRHNIFLDASLQKRCAELLRDVSERNGFTMHELLIAPDHVHLFLGIGPTHSISDAITALKCNSARALFSEYPELRKKFWRGHLWSSGKFYRSIGNVTAETIQHYIARSGHK